MFIRASTDVERSTFLSQEKKKNQLEKRLSENRIKIWL